MCLRKITVPSFVWLVILILAIAVGVGVGGINRRPTPIPKDVAVPIAGSSDLCAAESTPARGTRGNRINSKAHAHVVTKAFAQMSVASLFDAYLGEEGSQQASITLAFAARPDEGLDYMTARMRHGDGYEQYRAARLMGASGQTQYRPLLLDLALNEAHPAAVRTAAFYGLKQLPPHAASRAALFDVALNAEIASVKRSALAALSGNTTEEMVAALQGLTAHKDGLTQVYAGRLLMEQGHEPTPDFFAAMLAHEDYLVRQELYDALGWSDRDDAATLLAVAHVTERNQSAARAARLALGLYHARRAPESLRQQFFTRLLDGRDDHDRLWAVDTLMQMDPPRGKAALARLADEDSDFGMFARTRLLIRGGDLPVFPAEAASVTHKHSIPVHHELTTFMVDRFHAQPGAPRIGLDALDILSIALVREDIGIRPMNHAHNPLTGRGFIGRRGPGGSGRRYHRRLGLQLDEAVHAGARDTALTLAGRLLHLLEDMSSPLHIFGVWHPFNTCLFEAYWGDRPSEIATLLHHREIPPALPHHLPSESVPELDAPSRRRLKERLAPLPDSLQGYFDAQAWMTYFIASHWGELRFADAAVAAHTLPISEEEVETQDNVLARMFDGNIRYHTSWLRDYFEIEDRLGNTFVWNKCFALDGFRPAPNPGKSGSRDGHVRNVVRDGNRQVLRITGRFYFTQRGFTVPHCHPHAHPDGSPMERHLIRYYGETLFPTAVAYGIGWFNALAERAPLVFDPAVAGPKTHRAHTKGPGQQQKGLPTGGAPEHVSAEVPEVAHSDNRDATVQQQTADLWGMFKNALAATRAVFSGVYQGCAADIGERQHPY